MKNSGPFIDEKMLLAQVASGDSKAYWNDLRHWKLFGYLRGLPQCHGLGIVLKSGQTDVTPLAGINTVWTKFTSTVVQTDVSNIVIKDQYYIHWIPLAVLNRNPKLQQNNNWGGSFDPLQ